ncbi:MAG TPA: hypothetical protein VNQ76_19275 [Planctomicrobium sp.]|nr:hypothetical protein [Planctomicrobium sp.]
MLKPLNVAILGGVAALALTALLIIDRNPLVGKEDVATLNGNTSLYRSQPDDATFTPKPSTITTPKETTRPAWLDDEQGVAQPGNRGIPAPLEKGVVHLGIGASLGGRLPFPEDNEWNQPIDHLPVDPLSEMLIQSIGAQTGCHPAFGAGLWEGAPIGIPYVIVSGDQKTVPIRYTAYGEESDPGPYPIPSNAPIEGDPNIDGDRHVIVIDRDNWKLYELFRAFPVAAGHLWKAEAGAIFDMNQHPNRPLYWTSADAAGLPIFPGLVRYDEAVEQKEIRHALRFTVNDTRRAFVPPASHYASRDTSLRLPPMGMRVRLKKDFDITPFPEEVQVILRALKKYGMILADNGSDWYISGAPDPRWNDDNLHTLKKVKGHHFEVVQMEGMVEGN